MPAVQGPKKWFAKCDKHYPSRSGQTSLATAVANFTKPCTSHFFDLCREGNGASIVPSPDYIAHLGPLAAAGRGRSRMWPTEYRYIVSLAVPNSKGPRCATAARGLFSLPSVLVHCFAAARSFPTGLVGTRSRRRAMSGGNCARPAQGIG